MVRSIFQWNSALVALILLCCLFFTQPFCKASGSQCFTRDGNPNSDFPCYPTQSQSFCCGSGWACLPNRICAFPSTERSSGDTNNADFARGSCTDQSWASTSQCPDFCLGPGSRDKGIPMTRCDDPKTYCCGDNPSCNCTTGTGTISLPGDLKPFTTVGSTRKTTLNVSSPSVMTVTAKGGIQTWTETVTASPSTPSLSSTETSSTSTQPSSSTLTSIAASPSNSANRASSDSKEGIKVGAAVGVSLGVLIIASIAFFAFWRERRLKKHMKELKSRWIPVETYLNQRGVSTVVQPSSLSLR